MSTSSTSPSRQNQLDALIKCHAYLNQSLYPEVTRWQTKSSEQLQKMDKQILALGKQYFQLCEKLKPFENVLENTRATLEQKKSSQLVIQQIHSLCEGLVEHIEKTLILRNQLFTMNEQYETILKLSQQMNTSYYALVLNN